MFIEAKSFNQDLSKWNVNKVTSHEEFAIGSQIDNSNKLPKFKN
ncbi:MULTISPECIES: BspA family leucine-rich repeat surface protein [unclassified Spiroplasma]